MFEKIKKYFQDIKDIELSKAAAYARGLEEASSKFLSQQKSMTHRISELTKQNNDTELRIRKSADERIAQMEALHDTKCATCRQTVEEERQRFVKRQNLLAKKIADFDAVWMSMYQHANLIIDEHDVLLRSSGRLVASRNVLTTFKKQVDTIMEESAPLLSIELTDGSEDKKIDLPDGMVIKTHESPTRKQ